MAKSRVTTKSGRNLFIFGVFEDSESTMMMKIEESPVFVAVENATTTTLNKDVSLCCGEVCWFRV